MLACSGTQKKCVLKKAICENKLIPRNFRLWYCMLSSLVMHFMTAGVQMMCRSWVALKTSLWKDSSLRIISDWTRMLRHKCLCACMLVRFHMLCGLISCFWFLYWLLGECDNDDNASSLFELICDFFAMKFPRRTAPPDWNKSILLLIAKNTQDLQRCNVDFGSSGESNCENGIDVPRL